MTQQQTNTEISGSDKKTSKKYGRSKYDKVDKISKMDDDDLLAKLKKNVDSWYSQWDEFIVIARNHNYFLYIDQWDKEIRRRRESLSVPSMEFNHIRPMIDGIIGKQRKNSPQMYVTSTSGESDKSQVNYMTGLIRDIAYSSKSDEAYQTCFKNQLVCGWGFLRASVHYDGPNSFDQIIKLSSNEDFQLAFFDPDATDKHRANGDFCGIYQKISKDDFDRDYPCVKNPVSTGQETNLFWENGDAITVCDIYYKDYFKKTICKLSDGSIVSEKEAKRIIKEQAENNAEVAEDIVSNIDADIESNEKPSEPELSALADVFAEELNLIEIVEKRDVMDYTIKHVRFIENQILDKTDWPGNILPVVYVPGNSTNIDGRETPTTYVSDLRDSQVLHNYVMSDMARGLLSTTKTKMMGTAKMFEGHEQEWSNPQAQLGALIYTPDNRSPDGKPVPIDPPPFNAALLQMQQITANEMGVISGRYEESRGQESNAMSGIAIKERISASDNIVNLYLDNLISGIEQLGRVCLDLIPSVYGEERQVRIRGEDGESKTILLNKKSEIPILRDTDDITNDIYSMSQEIENDVNRGDFDIFVKASGSFDHQKNQSLEFWIRFMQAYPQSANLVADQIAGESDADGAQIIKDRLKILLPPEILAKEEGRPMPPPQPNPMEEIQKMQIQLLLKELELKEMKIENDKIKSEADIAMDMQDLDIKKEELEFKQEKAAEDAKIARLRASIEMKKINDSRYS